ncbi:MAG: tetratricopeptide repeat protein [Alphaproteobacteria bacterium]|nr:tetratricopeptide repeat protein [Alphaproteobacteria bacterium]
MEHVLKAIRERRLDSVGAAYAVVAWVIVQGASIALPAFDAPAWVMRWLIVASFAGFPAALAVAWVLLAPDHVEARRTVRRDWVLLGGAALMLLASLGHLAISWSTRQDQPHVQRPHASAIQTATVAVLPFANLSGDPERRYFSDGISEQLISELARQPDLRVAARTSSFALAEQKMDVQAIARRLNVRAVVDGSVREYGDSVRITAELINAGDGFQIWSETYDRKLTDILALQDEIARAISTALAHRLLGRAPSPVIAVNHPAIDPKAYRLFLQGQDFLAKRTPDGERRAAELFDQVVKLAPGFADGYAALGYSRAVMAMNQGLPEQIEPAMAALKKALELDRSNTSALVAHATLSIMRWEWSVAIDELARVKSLHPDTAQVWHAMATLYGFMGLPEQALRASRNAVTRDPLSYIDRYNIAAYLVALGRYQEGIAAAKDALAIVPDHPDSLLMLCRAELGLGHVDAARGYLDRLTALSPKQPIFQQIACKYRVDIVSGKVREARKFADAIAENGPVDGINATDFVSAYRMLGDYRTAMMWAEKSYDRREPWMMPEAYTRDLGFEMYQTPEWKAFEQKPYFRQWLAVRARIEKELPA